MDYILSIIAIGGVIAFLVGAICAAIKTGRNKSMRNDVND